MRRTLAIGLVCLGLGGCTLPNPFQSWVPAVPDLPGDLAKDAQACEQHHPLQVGTYVAYAQCVNEAVEKDQIPYAHYPELVRMQEQLRLKYAGLIDKGVMSPAEGARHMALANELVNAAIRNRDAGRTDVAEHSVSYLKMQLE